MGASVVCSSAARSSAAHAAYGFEWSAAHHCAPASRASSAQDGAPAHALLYFCAADVARVKRLVGLKGGGGRAKVRAAEEAIDAVAAYAANAGECRRAQLDMRTRIRGRKHLDTGEQPPS
jgi:hypothetical protein